MDQVELEVDRMSAKSKLRLLGRQQLIDLYYGNEEKGIEEHTITDIAKMFECSHPTVINYMKELKIKRRDPRERYIHGFNFSQEFEKAKEVVKKTGEEHPAWKGGSFIDKDGYRQVYIDGKYRREHRVIAEAMLDRPLKPQEDVHHIDGNKVNNVPENLQVVDKSYHNELHEAEKEELYG